MSEQPTSDDLMAIAEQVWSSYLDPEGMYPLLLVEAPSRVVEVSASVSVTGAWRGHVVLSCSLTAGKKAAAGLLGIESDEVMDEDLADALGELANIIGGNVKSLLAEPCVLSLPHVVVGRVDSEHWPATTEVCQIRSSWQDEMVSISVLESVEDNNVQEGAAP